LADQTTPPPLERDRDRCRSPHLGGDRGHEIVFTPKLAGNCWRARGVDQAGNRLQLGRSIVRIEPAGQQRVEVTCGGSSHVTFSIAGGAQFVTSSP
jgi:hypothetical protein